MGTKRILLVEDEKVTRLFLEKTITDLGYEVLACENGEQAIQNLDSFVPDLILSDIMMPEFSGLQLLNFVQKKIARKIPVLLISTLDENTMLEMVDDIGAAGFIAKPPQKEALKISLAKVLGE